MKKHYTNLIIAFLMCSTSVDAQQVILGTGTAVSLFSPISRIRDYSVYEIIYHSSDINVTGDITHFAFERADGDSVNPIQDVSIYMKMTSDSTLANGTYSNANYQLVYQGTFPNDVGAGWREVALSSPFTYSIGSNLQVLTVKGYEVSLSGNPIAVRWRYSTITGSSNRARRYTGADPIDSTTSLTTINFYANARLTFGSVGTVEISDKPFSIYPNPVSDKLYIEKSGKFPLENLSFSLYDIHGKLVASHQLNDQTELSLKDFDSGIYFYRVYTNDQTWTGKLIIQN